MVAARPWLDWKRRLAVLHRYLGIGLCLFFAMWFATGAVMLFQPYPALTSAQRFECLEPIDLGRTTIHHSLLERGSTEATSRIRLTSLAGRAVVHVHRAGGIDSFWADTGNGPIHVDAEQARGVAERCGWGGMKELRTVTDDQWTVHEGFADHRPLHRVRLDDRPATDLYVSSRTGEVVQRTTRAERGWNWMGSVPHWIYATAIRRHWELWDSLVWWLASAGTVGVGAGLLLGVVRWRQSPRSRISPFDGAMYWHHVSGLGAGLVVLAWILSGGLSMDHGRLFSTDAPTPEQRRSLAGTMRFAGEPSALFAPLSQPHAIKEIEWLRVAGRSYVAARLEPGHQRVAAAHARESMQTQFDRRTFREIQGTLVPGARLLEQDVLETFDTYYYGRIHTPRPLPVLRLKYSDPASTWLHIDLATGGLLQRLDASRRRYRFWFNALHSHDLPWMLDRPVLRLGWLVVLCGVGFLFSCNGVWISWKRLRPPRSSSV